MEPDFPKIDTATHRPPKERRRMLHKEIRNLIEEASRAQSHRAHTPVGMHEPTHYIPTTAARSMFACLKTSNLPALFDKGGKLRRAPAGAPAGVTVKMDAAIAGSSRVANAGAHVVVFPASVKAHAIGKTGDVAVESIPSQFRNIEAALFGVVDVESEADAPTIALPVLDASIDWKSADVRALGVRFEIPRGVRRRVDPEQLSEEVAASLTLGLARAADAVLLSALIAETLTPFTLAKAAAQGLVFDELRGLVGTGGDGAAVGQDGKLRAAGIASELTGDMADTIVGAWNRAGVAVNEDVSVHVQRTDNDGQLLVTAWASMLALVPDANKFWTVA
jgi:hypothetical protein